MQKTKINAGHILRAAKKLHEQRDTQGPALSFNFKEPGAFFSVSYDYDEEAQKDKESFEFCVLAFAQCLNEVLEAGGGNCRG